MPRHALRSELAAKLSDGWTGPAGRHALASEMPGGGSGGRHALASEVDAISVSGPWTPPAAAEHVFTWDAGNQAEWSAVTDASAQLAVTAAAARSGPYGMRFTPTVRANANVRRAITSAHTITFGWRMRISPDFTVGVSPGQFFVAQFEQGTTRKASLGLYEGASLRVIDWQNFNSPTGGTLTRGQWHDLTFTAAGVGTAAATITLTVNGSTVATRAGSDWSSVSISNVRFGVTLDQAWGTPAGYIDFDDAYIDTAAA